VGCLNFYKKSGRKRIYLLSGATDNDKNKTTTRTRAKNFCQGSSHGQHFVGQLFETQPLTLPFSFLLPG
jgi:hypothetical protein